MPMSSSAPAPSAGSSSRSVGSASHRRSRGRRAPDGASRSSPAASRRARARTTGWQAIHMASIRNSPRSRASANSSSAVGGVERQRLLAQHRLAGLERQPGVLEVQGVRRGDVHHVDVGVGDQLLVAAVRRAPGPPYSLRRRRGADSCDARPDGGELGVRNERPGSRRSPARCGRWRGSPSGSVCPWGQPLGGSARHDSPRANDTAVVRRLQWSSTYRPATPPDPREPS